MTTTELRDGDKVRVLPNYSGFFAGPRPADLSEGVVDGKPSAFKSASILVQFPGWTGGHDGDAHDGVVTDRWWIAPEYLEKIPPVFEPGMKVRIREDVAASALTEIFLPRRFSNGTPVPGYATTVVDHRRANPTRVYLRTPSESAIYVHPDMLEVITEEKETTVNTELEEFKKKVWQVGMKMARRHDLCDVVKDVMTEQLGLSEPAEAFPEGTIVANGNNIGRHHVARKNSRGTWGVSGSIVDKTFDEMLDSLGIGSEQVDELRVLWTPEGN